MKYDKSFLRNKSLLLRKRKYLTVKKFNYNLIFGLIRKHFHSKKITIGGYYPSNYEVNILKFEEWGIPKYHELVLVTSEEYFKNNEEIVEKFVDAFSRGYKKSIENNDESMEALIAAFPEVNIELETQGIKLLSPLWQESFDSDGMDSWIKFGDWMKDKELIDRNLDVEKSLIK